MTDSTSNSTSNPHAEFIQGLRELADFYQAHPELPLPGTRGVSLYGVPKEQVVEFARIFGQASKSYFGEYFSLTKKFSGGVEIAVYADRKEVCTPVVIGTKVESAYFRPAEHVPERVVDEIEWRCSPLLAPDEPQPEPVPVEEVVPLIDDDIPF